MLLQKRYSQTIDMFESNVHRFHAFIGNCLPACAVSLVCYLVAANETATNTHSLLSVYILKKCPHGTAHILGYIFIPEEG